MPPPPTDDRDRHVRRSGDDYASSFLTLLPQGQAWPKRPGSTLERACNGLAQYWGFVDSRAADFLERESDPRYAVEMFPDWERAWGLPDPCFFHDTGSLESRRAILMLKMTLLGAQSREFFMWVAEMLGYTITIHEYAPFMAGVSQVGDTRPLPLDPNPLVGEFRWYIGPPEMRFYWTISVADVSLIWFRSAAGQAGVDPHLRIGVPEDLACLFNKWKPAHTMIVFDFANMSDLGPMEGTP